MPTQSILGSALYTVSEYLTSLGLLHNSVTMLILAKTSVVVPLGLYLFLLNTLIDGIVLFTLHWGLSWVLNKFVKPILLESQLFSRVISPILAYMSGSHIARIFENMGQDTNKSDLNQTTNSSFLNFVTASAAYVTTALMAFKGHSFPNPYASLFRYFGTWIFSAPHWYLESRVLRAPWSLSRIGTGLLVAESIAVVYRRVMWRLVNRGWVNRGWREIIDPYDSAPQSEVRLFSPQYLNKSKDRSSVNTDKGRTGVGTRNELSEEQAFHKRLSINYEPRNLY